MKGVCEVCNDGKEKQLAKKRPPLCGYHYSIEQRKKSAEKNKDKPKKVQKQLKRTAIVYKRKASGEGEMFLKIWSERKHICSCCDKKLGDELNVSYMSHLLSKGAYPSLRLDERNIMIKCTECHYEYGNGNKNQEKFKVANEITDKLRLEYYSK